MKSGGSPPSKQVEISTFISKWEKPLSLQFRTISSTLILPANQPQMASVVEEAEVTAEGLKSHEQDSVQILVD